MNINSIGLTIKELRTKSKMSQDDLANKVFVSRQAISNWECGKTYPDIDNIKKLSEIFNVPLEKIISGNNKENNVCEVLYGETVKEKNKNKKLFKLIILLGLLLVFLLSFSLITYFFIDNYKTTRVYRVDSENHIVTDGIFVVTNESWYLKLGSFYTDKNIKRIKAYLIIDGKEELICDGLSADYTFKEQVDYDELFRFSEKETINNFYLEITYDDDSKETTKVTFDLEYENSKIIRDKQESITEKANSEVEDLGENYELREKMPKKFKKINERKYQYEFKYNNESYVAEYIDEPKRLEIVDGKHTFRITVQLNTFNAIMYNSNDGKTSCIVKTKIIEPEDTIDCGKELEEKIVNIYKAFENEMNS